MPLRITVELVPFGLESQKRELARLDITNTGHENHPIEGNYVAKFVTHLPNGDVSASQRVLSDFSRLRWNVWGVIYAALAALGEQGMKEGADDSRDLSG